MEPKIKSTVYFPSGRDQMLEGELIIPEGVCGLSIILRTDVGNEQFGYDIISGLHDIGFATFLLNSSVGRNDDYVNANSDINAEQVMYATLWARRFSEIWELPLTYVATGPGAAMVLKAAARLPETDAVVCCGAINGMSCNDLLQVKAATLLLTNNLEDEFHLLDIYNNLRCKKKLIATTAAYNRGENISPAVYITKWLIDNCITV